MDMEMETLSWTFFEWLWIPFCLTQLIALVAIFKLKNWGRKLWLVTIFATFLWSLELGAQTFQPFAMAVGGISGILNGVLIAMMWLEPYSSLFKRKV
jgi:hypothetical protein